MQQFWSIRQNPRGSTDQQQMYNLIISQQIVTCPFGHFSEERNNVLDDIYNESDHKWASGSQDRRFIEEMYIGDIIVIPLTGMKKYILAKITTNPIYSFDTKLFYDDTNTKIFLSKNDKIPFRPTVRKIEIINDNLKFPSHICPVNTLAKFKKPSIILKIKENLIYNM